MECIIVNDASNDGTDNIINQFKDERLKYYKHEKPRGASAARNLGIKHAIGDFVAFLDDDDEWLSTKLEKQITLLESLPSNYGMVYCWMDYYENKENLIQEHHPLLKGSVFLEVLDAQRLGGCPTLLVRRQVFDKIGLFNELLPRGNDGDFIRRVCRKYKVDLVPEVLVKVYTNHGKRRISQNDKNGLINHIYSQKHKLRIFRKELKASPLHRKIILNDIAESYYQIGKKGLALQYFIRSGEFSVIKLPLIRFFNKRFKGLF